MPARRAGRVEVGGDDQSLSRARLGNPGSDRRVVRRLPPVVDVGDGGPPGAELRERHRQVDAGRGGALPVLVSDARGGFRLGHGAVDGEPGGIAHLVQKRRFDRLLARRQHQFQLGTGLDIGPHRPACAGDRIDLGQPHRQRQAVKVHVRNPVARMASPVGTEDETAPTLGVQRAVEKGAAPDNLAVEGDRKRIMARGGFEDELDAVLLPVRIEGDRGSMGPGRLVIELDLGRFAAEEVVGIQNQPIAGTGGIVFVEGAPAHRAAPA